MKTHDQPVEPAAVPEQPSGTVLDPGGRRVTETTLAASFVPVTVTRVEAWMTAGEMLSDTAAFALGAVANSRAE